MMHTGTKSQQKSLILLLLSCSQGHIFPLGFAWATFCVLSGGHILGWLAVVPVLHHQTKSISYVFVLQERISVISQITEMYFLR